MIEGTIIPGTYRFLTSRLYCCYHCGTAWARLSYYHPDTGRLMGFEPQKVCCENCPSLWPNEIPGSLADGVALFTDGHGTAHLPPELLYRELDMLEKLVLTTPKLLGNITPMEPTTQSPLPRIEDRIAELRSKVLSKTITDAELREGIAALRADRTGASVRRTETKKRESATKQPVDVSALLAALLGPKTL